MLVQYKTFCSLECHAGLYIETSSLCSELLCCVRKKKYQDLYFLPSEALVHSIKGLLSKTTSNFLDEILIYEEALLLLPLHQEAAEHSLHLCPAASGRIPGFPENPICSMMSPVRLYDNF